MTNEDTATIAVMLHHDWSQAAMLLDTVKEETDDGSADWQEFHEIRLTAHTEKVRISRELLDRFQTEFRNQIREAMGI